jgi:hypothetical protein
MRDGNNFYWNYTYRFEESDFPAFAPLHLDKRRIRISIDNTILERWNIYAADRATVTAYDGLQYANFQFSFDYEGPTAPGDNTVRIILRPNEYGIAGYYELTFYNYNAGRVSSSISVQDPNDPNKRIEVNESARFTIELPLN